MENNIDEATLHTRDQLESYHNQVKSDISKALEKIRVAEEEVRKAQFQLNDALYALSIIEADKGIVVAALNKLDLVAKSPSKRKFVAGITTIVLTHRNFIHFFFRSERRGNERGQKPYLSVD
jgi:hypothetical protein